MPYHVVCFDCVGQYQLSSESDEASCPYCRGEIPDVLDKATESVELYLYRASASSKGSEEEKKYAKASHLAEMDSLDELANAATEDAAPEDSQGLYIF